MTYTDLPEDWPTRSLADPAFAVDVVDLCVSNADRAAGGLTFLFCRPDGSLAQPVFFGDLPGEWAERDTIAWMAAGSTRMAGTDGFVLAVARGWGGVTDRDRRLHQAALDECRAAGITLWGAYLATGSGVTLLPVAAGLETPRPGAA